MYYLTVYNICLQSWRFAHIPETLAKFVTSFQLLLFPEGERDRQMETKGEREEAVGEREGRYGYEIFFKRIRETNKFEIILQDHLEGPKSKP